MTLWPHGLGRRVALLLGVAGVWLIFLGLPGKQTATNNTVSRLTKAAPQPAAAGLEAAITPESIPPEVLAGVPAAEAALRERAQRRVEAIRAAQEQLRQGANPEDVKAPELPGRQ